MISMMEARDQKFALTQEEIMAKSVVLEAPKPPESSWPEPEASPAQPEEAVSFTLDPCTMLTEYPVQDTVVAGADLPSFVLSGWGSMCPPHWSLAGRLRENPTFQITPLWMEEQRIIDVGLCLFIAMQWFLLGGFPLVRTRKWWADPGAFITACTVVAGAIALIPYIDGFAKLPASIAMLAWLWWFGLLLWRTFQFGWRMSTAWRVPRVPRSS